MFKINISEKSGKTYKLESETEGLIDKALHDKISGKELLPNLEGYELEITGTSDKAGFTAMENVEGIGLNRVLLSYGKAMHKRPRREGKKKVSNPRPKGLRMRKTVRGKVISPEIIQINLKVLKEGAKKLSEIFPEQNKTPEPEVKSEEVAVKQSQDNKPGGISGDETSDETNKNNNESVVEKNSVQKGGASKTPKEEKP
ncbi:hypothetical protein KAT24_02255, partial [Candidatus Pacearchaeota archaeon]|nr:hypothetical protein [Candidatus Pacearchaeota archaeon]